MSRKTFIPTLEFYQHRMVYFQTYKVDESKKPDNFLEIALDETLLDVKLQDDAATIIPAKFDVEILQDVEYDMTKNELYRTIAILITIDDNLIKDVDEDDYDWWFNSKLVGYNLSEEWCEFCEKTFEVNFTGMTELILGSLHTSKHLDERVALVKR